MTNRANGAGWRRGRISKRAVVGGCAAAVAAVFLTLGTIGAGAYALPGSLKAKMAITPANRYADHVLTFDGSASTVPAGDSISSYQWSFGDGATATTSTPTVTHTYTSGATYQVQLVIVDASGVSSHPARRSLGVASDSPSAPFGFHPRAPKLGDSVTFDGSHAADGDGDAIVSYEWTFGDGGTETATTPQVTHRYETEGTFTASLVVVDSLGNRSAPTTKTVVVVNGLTAQLRFSPARPRAHQDVHFDASGSGPLASIVAYRWKFGDGHEKLTSEPFMTHSYRRSGIYPVSLTVLGFTGRYSDPAQVSVVVGPALIGVRHIGVRVCLRRAGHCPGTGLLLRITLSARDRAKITVRRRGHRVAGRRVLAHRRTRVFIRLRGRPRHRYTVSVRPVGGTPSSVRVRWP